MKIQVIFSFHVYILIILTILNYLNFLIVDLQPSHHFKYQLQSKFTYFLIYFQSYLSLENNHIYIFKTLINRSQLPFWRIFNILLIRILIPSLLLALVYFTAFRVRRKIAKQTQTTRQEQLKALEIIVFKKTDDEEISCAICLDDFHEGDRLRLLPCQVRNIILLYFHSCYYQF